MALRGIGDGDGSGALEKLQQARELARRKLDGDENRSKLADLIKSKQAEITAAGPQNRAAKIETARSQEAGTAQALPGRTPGPAGAAGYSRASRPETKDSLPGLGRYVDIVV